MMRRYKFFILATIISGALLTIASFLPLAPTMRYDRDGGHVATAATPTPVKKVTKHIKTPEPVKAIYMTSWVAGTTDWRDRIITLIDETEVNSIVVDIKDYTGRRSFIVTTPSLVAIDATEERIPDIKEFLELLHSKNIYVIGRISVFQDPHLVSKRPDLAVRRSSDGAIWKDYKGISWLDASARDVWDYAATIAEESYALGFDELNFDYIRFPSDGNMRDISYPFSENRPKHEVMRSFFSYLDERLRKQGIPISADLFGMTTTNTDDLNIGQVLEDALPNFDFVAPMVYPSHYPPGFNGYKDPNTVPYEIIQFSMAEAVVRAKAQARAASTTPNSKEARVHPLQLRPWLQDFDYGGIYDVTEVRAQKKAVYDVGLTSWMLWDPGVRYTKGALDPSP